MSSLQARGTVGHSSTTAARPLTTARTPLEEYAADFPLACTAAGLEVAQEPLVYAVQVCGDGPVKIGRTTLRNVGDRMRSLQRGCPYPLEPVAVFAARPQVEVRLHEHLARHQIRGEWYEPDSAVFGLIQAASR